MFARLKYDSNDWTPSGVLSDIKDVLTGESSLSNLVGCTLDEVNSELVTSVASGWTVHDDISSTEFVVKAAITDDPSEFKYVRFYVYNSFIYARLYDDWNSTTHVGTDGSDPAGTTDIYGSILVAENNVSKGITLFLRATQSHIFATTLKNHVTDTNHFLVSEFTREDGWNTPANGLKPVFQSFRNSWPDNAIRFQYRNSPLYNVAGYIPRLFSPVSGNYVSNVECNLYCDLGSNANAYTTGYNGLNAPIFKALSQKYTLPDATQYVPKISLGIHAPLSLVKGGDFSSVCGVYMLGTDAGVSGDEIVLDSDTYVILRVTSTYCAIVLKE